ncbi:hypothetical protein [Halostella pelagica]|uniref:hypothetical protein n=1 Tax=Halostella pelagica TaxID=2583824 RepID=UPI0010813831|nr:hypothetical protein [Halostella pelagica]
MVQFQDLLESSSCTTDAEIVGLALWYLHEYESVDYALYDDLGDVLRSAGVILSSQNSTGIVTSHSRFVIEPVKALVRRDLVIDAVGKTGYKLSEEGYEHIESKIDRPLPDEEAPNNRFLEVEADGFHADAIQEINLCYNVGAYSATLVMTRRLIEDLIIDLYRAHFGEDDIHKYYVPSSGRHKRLGELLRIFENHLDELANYTTAIDNTGQDFSDDLDKFAKRANSQAHSVNIHISKKEIADQSSAATRMIKILLEMRSNARSAQTE